MRWIILALVTIASLVASPVSSSNYRIISDPKFLIYGDNEASGTRVVVVLPPPPSLEEIQFLTIKKALVQFTDEDNAERTARRYIEDNEGNPEDDPFLWAAMDIVESGCKSTAVSPAGAQGRLQVMPFWKREPGFEFYRGKKSHLNDDLNFQAAKKIYRIGYVKTQRKWKSVERYCGVGPDAEYYREKVQHVYHQIKRGSKNIQVRPA